MAITRSSLLGPLVLVASCGPTPATPRDASDLGPGVCLAQGAMVSMGSGVDGSLAGYRRLPPEGAEVYITPGTQGGQHLWIGLRGTGFDPTQPRVELRAYRVPDQELLGQLRVRLPMTPAPEDPSVWALPSQQLVLEDDRYCSVLPGDVRVTMDFDDGRGHCAHQEVTVHVAGIDPLASPLDVESRSLCCTLRYRRCFPDGGGGLLDAVTTDLAPRDAGLDAAAVDP